jgi:hypothetical protein
MAQAVTIFQAKTSAVTADEVATVYGVSEKAIRDIWNGRTWSRETWHLDTSRPLHLKLTGRPKGCRDSKPRKRRCNSREEKISSTSPTAQVPCRPHTEMHSVAGNALKQTSLQITLGQHANLMIESAHSTELAACFEGSSAWHQSTSCHASVDEQLHEWDAFWRASTSVDPFSGDWWPCLRTSHAP